MLTLKAHAKINLHLHVGPVRNDGYHGIQTIFQQISLHDTLKMKLSGTKIKLSVKPKGLPENEDNLIVKALEMLKKKLGAKKGIDVQLVKRIPVGAGLGGGSSDAAAALIGGWRLWTGKGGKPAAHPKEVPGVLKECARKLGADVSYFLFGGTMWGEGIGDELTPIDGCKKRWVVVIYPKVHVSTKLAYQLLDDHRDKNPTDPVYQQECDRDDIMRLLRSMKRPAFIYPHGPYNSFLPVILAQYPEVAEARQDLSRTGCAPIMLSGSGSSVFGFVGDKKEGQSVITELKGRPWDVFLTYTIH